MNLRLAGTYEKARRCCRLSALGVARTHWLGPIRVVASCQTEEGGGCVKVSHGACIWCPPLASEPYTDAAQLQNFTGANPTGRLRLCDVSACRAALLGCRV